MQHEDSEAENASSTALPGAVQDNTAKTTATTTLRELFRGNNNLNATETRIYPLENHCRGRDAWHKKPSPLRNSENKNLWQQQQNIFEEFQGTNDSINRGWGSGLLHW